MADGFADALLLGVFDKDSGLTLHGLTGARERTIFDTFDIEFDQHRRLVGVDFFGGKKIVDGNGLDLVRLIAGSAEPFFID